MNSDRMKVLDLLEKGVISAEEATRLIEAVEHEDAPEQLTPEQAQKIQGKKLRVEVKGDSEDSENMNVNVSVPLVLARHLDNILANCIPKSASDELKQQGVNLNSIKLGPIIDTLEDLDEDIVNADIKDKKNDLKVRLYVE